MNTLINVLEKGLTLTEKFLNDENPLARIHSPRKHNYRQHSGKDYNTLKNECLRSHSLFSDPEFPAGSRNLLGRDNLRRIEWKRPHEISRNPRFFVDGASRFDLTQGELGDCWLIATIANLTLNKDLFKQVVPQGQEFSYGYAGIFYFRFWCFGEWREIVVDDMLPTYNGKLIYVRSQDSNEYWPSLLEKAYAKLLGSYEALDGGISSDAMIHFTGGVTEMIDLNGRRGNLYEEMNKGMERGSLLAASIKGGSSREQKQSNGLVRGHAYSITNVCWVNMAKRPGRPAALIRMRNPWGNDVEWKGPWSDGSREWSYVSGQEKKVLGIQFQKDGEFWISFEDFMKNFDYLEMTNVNVQSLVERDLRGKVQHMWKIRKFEGSWIRGSTAGGCSNFSRSFQQNPKFFITLTEADDGNNDKLCTMILALLQKPRGSTYESTSCHAIGFALFRVTSQGDYNDLSRKQFRSSDEVRGLKEFIECNQVSHRFNLPVGRYCIMPSTMNPGAEADFILRIFTEKAPEILNMKGYSPFRPAFSEPENAPYPTTPAANGSIEAPHPSGDVPTSSPYPVPPAINAPYPVAPAINTPAYAPYPTMPASVTPAGAPYPIAPAPNNAPYSPYPIPPNPSYPIPPSINPPIESTYPVPPASYNPGYSPYPQQPYAGAPSFSPYPPNPGMCPSMPVPFQVSAAAPSAPYPPEPRVNAPVYPPNFPAPQDINDPFLPSHMTSQNDTSNSGANRTMAYPPIQGDSNPFRTACKNPQSARQMDSVVEIGDIESTKWNKLQSILRSSVTPDFAFDGFNKTLCRSMITITNDDQSFELDKEQLTSLLAAIEVSKTSFFQHNSTKSGMLDSHEFRSAMDTSGFIIPNETIAYIMRAYGDNGRIPFDNFLLSHLRLDRAIKNFNNKQYRQQVGNSLSLEEYLESCL